MKQALSLFCAISTLFITIHAAEHKKPTLRHFNISITNSCNDTVFVEFSDSDESFMERAKEDHAPAKTDAPKRYWPIDSGRFAHCVFSIPVQQEHFMYVYRVKQDLIKPAIKISIADIQTGDLKQVEEICHRTGFHISCLINRLASIDKT